MRREAPPTRQAPAEPDEGERDDDEGDDPPECELATQAATVDEIIGGGERQEIGLEYSCAPSALPRVSLSAAEPPAQAAGSRKENRSRWTAFPLRVRLARIVRSCENARDRLGAIASIALRIDPQTGEVRPFAIAFSETMLSSRNSSTWSRVVVSAFGKSPERQRAGDLGGPGEARETPNGRPMSPPPLDDAEHELHRLAQGHDFGAAEFVGLPGLGRPVEGASGRERHVAHEDRLQPRLPAAEQRQHGHEACERGEAVEEFVFGSEHDRRAQASSRRERPRASSFAAALARDEVAEAESGAPMPEICTSVRTPAAAAARAISPPRRTRARLRSSAGPRWILTPAALTDDVAPAIAAATDSG